MTGYVIAAQYPILLFLIIASFAIARVYGAPRWYAICLGWVANATYLIFSSIRIVNETASIAFLGDTAVLLSSWLFLAAAALPSEYTRLRRYPVSIYVGTAICLIALALDALRLFVYFSPTEAQSFSFLYVSYSVANWAFHTFALIQLAGFYSRAAIEPTVGSSRLVLTKTGTLMYASIQSFLLLALLFSDKSTYVMTFGFLLGLSAKSIIALGYLQQFIIVITQFEASRARLQEAKSVIGKIIHEVATPMAEMILLTQTLRPAIPPHGKAREGMQRLEGALHRMEAILDAIRDVYVLVSPTLNSSSSGKSNERIRSLMNANSLLHRAILSVRTTRGETAIWRIHYSGNCCIRCVAPEIVQVFVNILRNAYDALIAGHGFISVTTTNVKAEDLEPDEFPKAEPNLVTMRGEKYKPLGFVKVVIRDGGEGVAPDVQPSIFTEGFSTRLGEGRGFGLAVVRELVERNGGSIKIVSPAFPERSQAPGTDVILVFPRVPCRQESQTNVS